MKLWPLLVMLSACGGSPFSDALIDQIPPGDSGTPSVDSAADSGEGDSGTNAGGEDSGTGAQEAGESDSEPVNHDAGPAPTEANALAECQAYALVHAGGTCWGDWQCTEEDGGKGPVMMCYASQNGDTCIGQCWGYEGSVKGEVLACDPCGKEIGIW